MEERGLNLRCLKYWKYHDVSIGLQDFGQQDKEFLFRKLGDKTYLFLISKYFYLLVIFRVHIQPKKIEVHNMFIHSYILIESPLNLWEAQ